MQQQPASPAPPKKWGQYIIITLALALTFYYVVIEGNWWLLSRAIWTFLRSLF